MEPYKQVARVEDGWIVFADGSSIWADEMASWLRQIADAPGFEAEHRQVHLDLCWGAGALEEITADKINIKP